jgi:branched-chain amino acid transport system substrate-binding protein
MRGQRGKGHRVMDNVMSGVRKSAGRPLRIGIVTSVVAVAVAAGGCGTDQGSSATQNPLTIGISLSLTGNFADPGKAAQRGYELWADAANAEGGILDRSVVLKIVDDASLPERAADNYEKLISTDRVDLVLGPYSSKLTIPSSQVVARHGYAFVEPAGGAPKVFAQKLNNLFFVQPAPTVQQGGVFAEYVLSRPAAERPKTAAYTVLDDPFSQPIAVFVRDRFERAGIKTIFSHTYAEGADLAPVMAKVAAARPDVLVAATQSEDGYAAVRSLVGLRWGPRWLYLTNGANSPVEFPAKVGAANVNGIFTSGDWFPGSNTSGSAAFVGAYLTKYGGSAGEIDNTSVEAYSAGLLLQQVAQKTNTVDNAAIIKALHQGTWLTPVGDLSWDAAGAPKGSYILMQWIDGKLQAIYPPGRAQNEATTARLPWAK